MFRLSLILSLAAGAAAVSLAPAPSYAFIGYGIEAGTPLYDALENGYRPWLDGRHYRAQPPARLHPHTEY